MKRKIAIISLFVVPLLLTALAYYAYSASGNNVYYQVIDATGTTVIYSERTINEIYGVSFSTVPSWTAFTSTSPSPTNGFQLGTEDQLTVNEFREEVVTSTFAVRVDSMPVNIRYHWKTW
jgi:hypothetical protein